MRFERCPLKELPGGEVCKVFPFHLSMHGLECRILCRDDTDYDYFVKCIVLCALRRRVIVVMYVVVSNHAHMVLLAKSQEEAEKYGDEVKRCYSMYFGKKYSEKSSMKHVNTKAIFLDTDWYLRNAIAYDIRNAIDNGAESALIYRWSGYSGMFCDRARIEGVEVRGLNKREKRRLMHTDEDLSGVRWMLDKNGCIIPATVCDWRYLEAAFCGNQAYFLKMIGVTPVAEMQLRLVDAPRKMMSDNDFLRQVNDVSQRWFNENVDKLPATKKYRLLTYVCHSFRTTIPQLARIFELERDVVSRIVS